MKQVFEMKEMHEETRKQQKQARANTLEVEPDAILPELSGQCFSSVKVEPCNLCDPHPSDSPFWDSSGDDELDRIQQLKSMSR